MLSPSLLLFVQRFGRNAIRPSSGIYCRTREPARTREPSFRTRELSCNSEPSRNFEPNPLFSLRGYPVLIPLTIAGVGVVLIIFLYYCHRSGLNLESRDNCHLELS